MIKQALISIKAASCCLCMSVSPTLPKSIHTLSHPDETATDTAFVTLSRTAVETAIAVYTCCYAMPRSPLLLFWRWSTASSVSVQVGAHGRTTHSFPPLSLISHLTSVDVKQYVCLLTYDAWRTEFEQNVLWCLSGRWERLRHDISLWGKVNWENRITGFSVVRTLSKGRCSCTSCS